MNEPSIQMRHELDALPEVPLPDALWQRVEIARLRNMRRRRLVAGIASLAFAAVIAIPLLAPSLIGTDATQSGTLAASGPVRDGGDIESDLRVLDQALQAAYDRGASDAEIAPMWVARDALLAGIRSASTPSRADRI